MLLATHVLIRVQVRWKSVCNDGHIILEAETIISSVSALTFQWGDWIIPHGTPCTCARSRAIYVYIGLE
jgi:hypothetical protein